tara:strand:+ start:301 stop:1023 length:723 start_codon:yes stop_codon:yes gene_type:complete
MKKILLVSGCSYTDPNFYSIMHPDMDCNWPMWPELLAEKLDMQCVNLAMSGAGNEYIYSTLLDYITTNDTNNIGLIIAAWSQNQRKDFQKNDRWTNIRFDQNGDVYSWMKKSLRYYLSFKIMCEQYNIKYKNFQMINSYKDVLDGLRPSENSIVNGTYDKDFRFKFVDDVKLSEAKLLKIISSYENLLNENFIGWPLDKKLGGFNINQFLNNDDKISELDRHPNEKGQKKIMEIIYDRLG